MSKEVDDFILEHHGVPGMKWGVRRRSEGGKTAREQVREKRSGETYKQNQMRKLKTVAAVGGVVAIAAGAAYIARQRGINASKANFVLAPAGKVKLGASGPSLKNFYGGAQHTVSDLRARHAGQPMSKLGQFKELAEGYKRNPAAAEWLKTAAPASYEAIMRLNGN